MKKVLSIVLISVFGLLSALHFYWSLGGKWGFENSLPLNENGAKLLNPTLIDSFVMGLILGSFSMFYYFLYKKHTRYIFIKIMAYLIPIVFLLRAIGDFKYVGFFKKVIGNNFAKMDTSIYSPLCLAIFVIGFYIIYKK